MPERQRPIPLAWWTCNRADGVIVQRVKSHGCRVFVYTSDTWCHWCSGGMQTVFTPGCVFDTAPLPTERVYSWSLFPFPPALTTVSDTMRWLWCTMPSVSTRLPILMDSSSYLLISIKQTSSPCFQIYSNTLSICRFLIIHVMVILRVWKRATGLLLGSWRCFNSHRKGFFSSELHGGEYQLISRAVRYNHVSLNPLTNVRAVRVIINSELFTITI